MKMYRCKGTITVFLSIVSILFLSLACTLVESARLQGARAKAAAVSDISLFSVFGEYERGLLKNYDVFFLDGGYGSGEFQKELAEEHLKKISGRKQQHGNGRISQRNADVSTGC